VQREVQYVMSDILTVRMLGGFSIERGGQHISDQNNRMRKVWLLLAYLIHSRSDHVTQEHYLRLLQNSGGSEAADPNGRLKAIFYRARTMLDQLGSSAGRELILHTNGTYVWNKSVPLTLDTEEFEHLCRQASAAEAPDTALELYLQALDLYRGDFLPKLSMDPWVMPISTYYHQMFLDAAHQSLALLESRARWSEAAALCRKALKLEPYSEELYQHLMRCLLAVDDRAAALAAYEDMSELLFSALGIMPSPESRELYRRANHEAPNPAIPVGDIRDMLQEPAGPNGAMYCEYDFFRLLYQVQARSISRSGETIHIALLSVNGQGDKQLRRRSLDKAMDNLQDIAVSNLRQGDIVTKCSISQLIIMLPQANYENSCMVCRRIIKAFYRQYPHSPTEIQFSVQPLEPLLPER